MPDKYSLAKCEHYGRRLASRLSQQFFGPQPEATLDGPALLKFTPIRQVNLLVLRQLLGRWQQEANALRSPYFDFEAAPVRAALGQFMNVLSRHIRLDRAALEPLLAQAVADTLALATSPADAFERLLLPPAEAETTADEAVPLSTLRDYLRYFDQAKPFFEGFVESLPIDQPALGRGFLQQRFTQYLAAHAPELPALGPLLAEFGALLPLTEADLQDEAPAKSAPVASPAPPPAEPARAPEPAPTPVAAPSIPPAPPAPASASAATAVAPEPASPATEAPLYAKLKATQPSTPHLADTLRGAAGGASPLAERAVPKVTSLREAISINQRFSFINELFNGENMEYHAAIQHLDTLPTAEAATAYVQQELAAHHDWSLKQEHVGKLLKLIERKFAGA
ncbi:hypothetical protein GCM10023172_39570 [Hymenobacter ginsengisoli]|uniref:Uncharacterized protein n=1 Tax=Hymenobacter ginsengisoli TaxID=1051626 RepID=A0ABP8QQE4_9BACT|nr:MULTISPECIES: hypothetical protein [unclassified Hymenobacter]MBO2032908.1 hypothetical protein [Hymenobacter sp. BT559]